MSYLNEPQRNSAWHEFLNAYAIYFQLLCRFSLYKEPAIRRLAAQIGITLVQVIPVLSGLYLAAPNLLEIAPRTVVAALVSSPIIAINLHLWGRDKIFHAAEAVIQRWTKTKLRLSVFAAGLSMPLVIILLPIAVKNLR